VSITDCKGRPFAATNGGLTLKEGFSSETRTCLPSDLNEFELAVSPGLRPDEVRWTITRSSAHGPLWLEGGAPFSDQRCPVPAAPHAARGRGHGLALLGEAASKAGASERKGRVLATAPELTEAQHADMEGVFKKLDTTNNGALDHDELLAALVAIDHPNPSMEAVEHLLEEVGLPGKVELNLADFEVLWRYTPPNKARWSFKNASPNAIRSLETHGCKLSHMLNDPWNSHCMLTAFPWAPIPNNTPQPPGRSWIPPCPCRPRRRPCWARSTTS
jgi:hypothetical protein